MAVNSNPPTPGAGASSGKRVLVGTNVFVATALVVAIVVVAQLIAFRAHRRWDMTSSGVNSLSEGTENLLRGLDQNVRITSLYFETDREDDDQSHYRRGTQDLLDLYEATNRSAVRAEWVNPLKDHEKFQALLARLREKPAFNKEIGDYQARIDEYGNVLDAKIRTLVASELEAVSGFPTPIGQTGDAGPLAPVEQALGQLNEMLDIAREQMDGYALADNPQFGLATAELRSLYGRVSQTLKNIAKFGTEQAARDPKLSTAEADFLRAAGSRYAEVVAALEGETTRLGDLEPLKFDDLAAQLVPTGNAILVETDEDAKIVDFSSVWPPVQQGMGGRVDFKQRAFKGEEKLTSAILRTTHKEQTAIVFVRYGGAPLFGGGMPMMGQQPGPYARMKQQLEDANFVVEEWDLKTSEAPPTIEPAPTRTIHVVLKPSPPQRGPMGQPMNDPPFGENHRLALLDAIGDNGRALFIAGWHPGMFGPIPGTYEFADYLRDTWGITVESDALLVQTVNTAPGQYVPQQGFHIMRDLAVSDHDIVSGALARELGLPLCAPLMLSEPAPEGVERVVLATVEPRDGIWAEKDLPGFIETARSGDPLSKQPEDEEGPFVVAVAATKGDAKVVVVSSAEFAMDAVAFAEGFMLTSRGLAVRRFNPGNAMLVTNAMHWLNDNTEFMNIGTPIEGAVLEIANGSTVKAVQALTIFVWPLIALVGGGVAWWVRRR